MSRLNYHHRLFLAGDTMRTQPWCGIEDKEFLALIEEMRAADTTFLNLEIIVRTSSTRSKGIPKPTAVEPT